MERIVAEQRFMFINLLTNVNIDNKDNQYDVWHNSVTFCHESLFVGIYILISVSLCIISSFKEKSSEPQGLRAANHVPLFVPRFKNLSKKHLNAIVESSYPTFGIWHFPWHSVPLTSCLSRPDYHLGTLECHPASPPSNWVSETFDWF